MPIIAYLARWGNGNFLYTSKLLVLMTPGMNLFYETREHVRSAQNATLCSQWCSWNKYPTKHIFRAVKLSWIFPEAPLIFDWAPEISRVTFTGMYNCCLSFIRRRHNEVISNRNDTRCWFMHGKTLRNSTVSGIDISPFLTCCGPRVCLFYHLSFCNSLWRNALRQWKDTWVLILKWTINVPGTISCLHICVCPGASAWWNVLRMHIVSHSTSAPGMVSVNFYQDFLNVTSLMIMMTLHLLI